MKVIWTDTAKWQLRQILCTIRDALSPEDASRWYWKIKNAALQLADFPLIGAPLPPVTHKGFDDFFKGLRQIVVPPYRIVYELKEDVCEVLFCQRTEQMLTPQAQ